LIKKPGQSCPLGKLGQKEEGGTKKLKLLSETRSSGQTRKKGTKVVILNGDFGATGRRGKKKRGKLNWSKGNVVKKSVVC